MDGDPAVFLPTTLTAPHWKQIGISHHHGICVPLFSLHSQKSCGIGDFGDLPRLIDWCAEVGFDCIQLLPLNDTAEDSSPYNALSSCALDPIYLDLHDLPDAEGLDLSVFDPFKALLRLPHSDVRHQKLCWLFQYFRRTFENVKRSAEYRDFIQSNPWLDSYCRFKAHKDEYGGKHWMEWPVEKQDFRNCQVDGAASDFHRFLQFHANRQMKKVKRHAEQKSVWLKGDIPILLSLDSADAWAYPLLFDLEYVAGSPPDYYNRLGQKWGFPLFNWDQMRKADYSWWKQRLKTASQYFHIYRIDHVVGFFRIWAMHSNEKPSNGRYIPSDSCLWGVQGREILKMMITSSLMLPMAEDLGTIPDIVYEVLHEFGICGTKVVRWCRRWDSDGAMVPYQNYDPISLTTVSTPDSEPMALWWKNFPAEAQKLAEYKHWIYTPSLAGWQQKELLHDAHHTPSLFHINLLQEYLALFPDLVSSDMENERINVPGTLSPTNWSYRFKPSIEEIISHSGLAREIRDLLR
jgi:4-alpha-glucanotransferase